MARDRTCPVASHTQSIPTLPHQKRNWEVPRLAGCRAQARRMRPATGPRSCFNLLQYDHALALYPLPHLLVLADSVPFCHTTFEDCICLNPVGFETVKHLLRAANSSECGICKVRQPRMLYIREAVFQ